LLFYPPGTAGLAGGACYTAGAAGIGIVIGISCSCITAAIGCMRGKQQSKQQSEQQWQQGGAAPDEAPW
jgi:hypothetical protein